VSQVDVQVLAVEFERDQAADKDIRHEEVHPIQERFAELQLN
jgi:hypothetical protein